MNVPIKYIVEFTIQAFVVVKRESERGKVCIVTIYNSDLLSVCVYLSV